MKLFLSGMLMLGFCCGLSAQEKTDKNWKIGIQTVYTRRIPTPKNGFACALALSYKNVELSAGPVFDLKKLPSNPSVTFKQFGYDASLRYIFPQNKGKTKAFLLLNFQHNLRSYISLDYYDHLIAKTGPGDMPELDYSFNLREESRKNEYAVRGGVGVQISFSNHIYALIEGSFGGYRNASYSDYFNDDTGEFLTREETTYNSINQPAYFASVGFGIRF